MLSTEVFWPDTQRCLTSQYFRTRCGPITHQSSISRCLTKRCLTVGIYCTVLILRRDNNIQYSTVYTVASIKNRKNPNLIEYSKYKADTRGTRDEGKKMCL